MTKKLILIGLTVIALALAIVAAVFSISGLAKLFAGSAVAIIIMASVLEASKLLIASLLNRYWTKLNIGLKTYLTIALLILAGITSLGIYGYLSNAYQVTKSKFDLSQTKVDSLQIIKSAYEQKLTYVNQGIDFENKRLTQNLDIRNKQEDRATSIVNNKSTSGLRTIDNSSKRIEKEIAKSTKTVDSLNIQRSTYQDSINKLNLEITQVTLENTSTSELGPIQYISKLSGIDMDSIVNFFILILVFVFDPLSIVLVLAINRISNNEDNEPTIRISSPNISTNTEEITIDIPKEEKMEYSASNTVENVDDYGSIDINTIDESSTNTYIDTLVETYQQNKQKPRPRPNGYSGARTKS